MILGRRRRGCALSKDEDEESGWPGQRRREAPVRIPEARGVAVDGATGGDDDGGGGRGGAGEALLHVLVLPPQQGSHAAGAKIERVSSWRRETKELATCWVEFLALLCSVWLGCCLCGGLVGSGASDSSHSLCLILYYRVWAD
jgi:hypothetical protein